MYFERYEKLTDGRILRQVERQLELAEWQSVESGGWVRRIKEW